MDPSQIQWDSHDQDTIKWDKHPAYDPATDPTGPAAFNPAQGNNFAAGMGQGATDIGEGFLQQQAHNPLLAILHGRPDLAFSNEARKKVDQEVTDKAKIDKALLDTTSGKLGSVAGQTAVLGMAPGLGAGGGLAKVMGNAGLQGLEAGALQPVADAQDGPSVNSLITGKDAPSYDAQKLTQMLTGAGTGAATGGVLYGLGALANKLVPSNAAAMLYNAAGRGAEDTPFAKEGQDLVQKTGVNLTPGEITGNKAQIAIENNSRQSIASRNITFAADQNKTQQLSNYISDLIDNTAKQGGDPATVGQRVQGAVKNAVSTLSDQRASQAAVDYGRVNAMVQGKQAVIPQKYLDTLKSIGDELAGAPKNSDAAKLASSVADLQQEGLQNAYIPSLLKTRQYLSSVAGGQQRMASEAMGPQQRRIATQLLGAIDSDLDASADKLGGDIGAALKSANANYAQSSQQIEGIKNMALGKLVGDDFAGAAGSFNQIPGETVMQRIKAMKPSELDASVRLLSDHDPETLQAVKRSVLETALDRAQQMAPSEGANTLALHPNVFVNALAKTPEDQARLRVLFSPKEQSQISDALNVARRMSDKTGFNASGTAQAAEMTALGSSGTAALLGHPLPLLGLGGKMLGNRAIAQAMVNPEGRALIQQLNRLPPGSERFTQLSAQLAGLIGAQSQNPVSASGQ